MTGIRFFLNSAERAVLKLNGHISLPEQNRRIDAYLEQAPAEDALAKKIQAIKGRVAAASIHRSSPSLIDASPLSLHSNLESPSAGGKLNLQPKHVASRIFHPEQRPIQDFYSLSLLISTAQNGGKREIVRVEAKADPEKTLLMGLGPLLSTDLKMPISLDEGFDIEFHVEHGSLRLTFTLVFKGENKFSLSRPLVEHMLYIDDSGPSAVLKGISDLIPLEIPLRKIVSHHRDERYFLVWKDIPKIEAWRNLVGLPPLPVTRRLSDWEVLTGPKNGEMEFLGFSRTLMNPDGTYPIRSLPLEALAGNFQLPDGQDQTGKDKLALQFASEEQVNAHARAQLDGFLLDRLAGEMRLEPTLVLTLRNENPHGETRSEEIHLWHRPAEEAGVILLQERAAEGEPRIFQWHWLSGRLTEQGNPAPPEPVRFQKLVVDRSRSLHSPGSSGRAAAPMDWASSDLSGGPDAVSDQVIETGDPGWGKPKFFGENLFFVGGKTLIVGQPLAPFATRHDSALLKQELRPERSLNPRKSSARRNRIGLRIKRRPTTRGVLRRSATLRKTTRQSRAFSRLRH